MRQSQGLAVPPTSHPQATFLSLGLRWAPWVGLRLSSFSRPKARAQDVSAELEPHLLLLGLGQLPSPITAKSLSPCGLGMGQSGLVPQKAIPQPATPVISSLLS